jgi:hypothetical protein
MHPMQEYFFGGIFFICAAIRYATNMDSYVGKILFLQKVGVTLSHFDKASRIFSFG